MEAVPESSVPESSRRSAQQMIAVVTASLGDGDDPIVTPDVLHDVLDGASELELEELCVIALGTLVGTLLNYGKACALLLGQATDPSLVPREESKHFALALLQGLALNWARGAPTGEDGDA